MMSGAVIRKAGGAVMQTTGGAAMWHDDVEKRRFDGRTPLSGGPMGGWA